MKIMILIPCMDMVHSTFMRSLLLLNTAGHKISYLMQRGSLVYDSRNRLLDEARNCDVDALLWLDSDMDVPMNALQTMAADLEAGHDIVTGLCFKRKPPYGPCIYKYLELTKFAPGQLMPIADAFTEWPEADVFEVQGHGFATVMMSMKAANTVVERFGRMPFMPVGGFGEDLSFCLRAREAGLKLYCDSRVRPGHIGYYTFTEADYGKQ